MHVALAFYPVEPCRSGRADDPQTAEPIGRGCSHPGLTGRRLGFRVDSNLRLGISVGLLGGFTTFSTFAIDAIHLWEHGHTAAAIFSIAVTLVAGIGGAVLGVIGGRALAS